MNIPIPDIGTTKRRVIPALFSITRGKLYVVFIVSNDTSSGEN